MYLCVVFVFCKMLSYFLKIKLRTILYIVILLVLVLVVVSLIFINNQQSDFFSKNNDSKPLSIILWWTPFINNTLSRYISGKTAKCMITEDRNYLNNPQTSVILFYGTSFDVHDLPLPKIHNWALIHEESPKNVALFLHEDSWTIFNFTSTFSRNSHFPITLQHLPNIEILLDKKYFVPIDEKNQLLKHISPILYIQSDCVTPLERDSYVNELMKYISIDSYGKCLNNKELPEKLKENPLNNLYSDDFLKFVSQYKFVISFENSICNDYITEKLWRPLISGSIPIYLGSPTINDWLPNNKSAILVNDFDSPKDLIAYINKVNNDDVLYNSYVKHKIFGEVENQLLLNNLRDRNWVINEDDLHFFEAFEYFLCDAVAHEKNEEIINKSSVYKCPDLLSPLTKQKNDSNWWNDFWREGKCQAHLLKKYIEDKSIKKITKEMFELKSNRLIIDNEC